MPIFGLFGAFALLVLSELAGNSATRPVTRFGFAVVVLENGGVGPSAWLSGVADVVEMMMQVV